MFKKDRKVYLCVAPSYNLTREEFEHAYICDHKSYATLDCLYEPCVRLVFFKCQDCRVNLRCLTNTMPCIKSYDPETWTRLHGRTNGE